MNLSRMMRLASRKYQREGALPLFYASYQEITEAFCGKRIFQKMTTLRHRQQQYLYDAPADPYKVIEVEVDDVKYYNKNVDKRFGLGVIKSGEWDAPDNCVPIHETTHYRGLKRRFEDGLDWQDTEYYREKILDSLSQDVTSHDNARLEYFEDLYNDIKENGYRPNYERGHNAPEGGSRQGRLQHVHALEPLVTIGRGGEMYLNEGFHRLAIVKFLGIETIPVNVLARHHEWQQIRERIYGHPAPHDEPELQQYVSHPDVTDILSESTTPP